MRFATTTLLALTLTNAGLSAPTPNENTSLIHVAEPQTVELEARKDPITTEEKIAIISAGIAVFALIPATGTYISYLMKYNSDKNSCGVLSGSIDGINYQYNARTTGSRCDTQASQDSILKSVTNGMDYMKNKQKNHVCLQVTNGGTWKGLLQLAAGGKTIINGKCDDIDANVWVSM